MSISRSKAYLLCLLAAAAFVLLSGSELIDTEHMTAQSFKYSTSEVEIGDFVKMGSFSAAVYYTRQYNLRYTSAEANFQQYLIDRKNVVQKGDAVAQVVVKGSRAALTAEKIALSRMQKEYEEALSEQEEALAALQKGIAEAANPVEKQIARLEYEKAQIGVARDMAERQYAIDSLAERIRETEELYADTVVSAPYAGRVERLDTLVREGDSVHAGVSLGTISDPNSSVVVVKDEGALRYNMEVLVESGVKSNRVTYTGRVVAADNVLPDDLARGYAAIVLDEAVDPEDLRNLTIAYTQIRLKNVPVVARRAIKMDAGKYYASILDGETVKRRAVNQALYSTETALVLQGLEAGDIVILN